MSGYVFHAFPSGVTISHGPATTCEHCDDYETCADCGHSVEDDAHADGCEQCACPLHLTIGD